MHPETGWMIYQAEAAARQQRLQHQQRQHQLAYPCLQQRVAFWSGQYLLHCAQWLLRYGKQYEQWTLSMNDIGRGVRN
jgi:hypothetical protein